MDSGHRQAARQGAFRVLHAEDIGVGIARAIRPPSRPPGGVYLDLRRSCSPDHGCRRPAGSRSSRSSIRRRSRSPAADAVKRAVELLKGAKKPLIVLGKGAAYSQADADIRALVEKTGIPYLPMSMAKGLLPDTHPQCASPPAHSCCPRRTS